MFGSSEAPIGGGTQAQAVLRSCGRAVPVPDSTPLYSMLVLYGLLRDLRASGSLGHGQQWAVGHSSQTHTGGSGVADGSANNGSLAGRAGLVFFA